MVRSSTRRFGRAYVGLAVSGAAVLFLIAALTFFQSTDGAATIEAADVPQAVFAQFEDEHDSIHVAPLDNPATAQLLTTIGHERGWGIIGAVSPDGRWLAYTVLRPGGRRPQTEAEGHLLSLVGGGDRLVASGVDLQSRPVWSGDSKYATFVQGAAPEGKLGTFTVLSAATSGNTTEAGAITDVLGASPVGFTAGGALLVAVASPDGTRLDSLEGGARSEVAPLSASIARDFALSPDAAKLAFVEISPAAEPQVRLLDLTGGLRSSAALQSPSGGGATLGPVWTPAGDLTYGVATAGSPALVLRQADLRSSSAPVSGDRDDGFDVPLAWSPDGSRLAARAVAGTLSNVRSLQLAIIGPGGTRAHFGDADTKWLGWVPAGVGR